MKKNPFSFHPLVIFTFLFLLIASTAARAQAIEPDGQIKRQMLVYAAKVESAAYSETSRTRVFRQSNPAGQNEQKQINKEIESESSSAFALEPEAFDILDARRTESGIAAPDRSYYFTQVFITG